MAIFIVLGTAKFRNFGGNLNFGLPARLMTCIYENQVISTSGAVQNYVCTGTWYQYCATQPHCFIAAHE